MKVYVLTREINEYDQDGEYYEGVFLNKPSVEDLARITGRDSRYASWLMETGGGRIGVEDEWWNFYVEVHKLPK